MTDTIISTALGAIIAGFFGLIGIWFNHYLVNSRNNRKQKPEAIIGNEDFGNTWEQEKITKQKAKTIPQQLSVLNPLDHLRLLWWIFVMPQQLKDYKAIYNEEVKLVGQWLVSTLTWFPLFILTLTLGLELLPHSSKAWSVLRTPEKREDKNKINNFQYITLNNNLVHIEKSTHKH